MLLQTQRLFFAMALVIPCWHNNMLVAYLPWQSQKFHFEVSCSIPSEEGNETFFEGCHIFGLCFL